MKMPESLVVASFVSPHGFGHAARASAVLEALRARVPELGVEIFTTVPRWFFEDSLSFPFGYHAEACDVGLVQRDAVTEDVPATVRKLEDFLPFSRQRIQDLAEVVLGTGCHVVLADIAPLGVEVARGAGLPSVLVESFTWDWIYQAYGDEDSRMVDYGAQLGAVFDRADFRIQTRPICLALPECRQVGPICRSIRESREVVRRKMGVGEDRRLILATLGGTGWKSGWNDIGLPSGVTLVVPGGPSDLKSSAILVLPHRSGFQHADLLAACDGIVGKLGYSTVAEAYQAGIPLVFGGRRRFPETEILAEFVRTELGGVEVNGEDLLVGRMGEAAEAVLALPRRPRPVMTGAVDAAALILEWLSEGGPRYRGPESLR
jgi:hypothetical protein